MTSLRSATTFNGKKHGFDGNKHVSKGKRHGHDGKKHGLEDARLISKQYRKAYFTTTSGKSLRFGPGQFPTPTRSSSNLTTDSRRDEEALMGQTRAVPMEYPQWIENYKGEVEVGALSFNV